MKLSKDKLQEDFIKHSKDWVDTAEYNSIVYNYFEKQVNEYNS
jgi:hypothetical protein